LENHDLCVSADCMQISLINLRVHRLVNESHCPDCVFTILTANCEYPD